MKKNNNNNKEGREKGKGKKKREEKNPLTPEKLGIGTGRSADAWLEGTAGHFTTHFPEETLHFPGKQVFPMFVHTGLISCLPGTPKTMEGPGTGPVTHWDLAKIGEVPWVIKRMMQGETQIKKAGKLCRVIKRHKV